MGRFRKTILEIKNDLRSDKPSLKVFLTSYMYSAQFRVLLNHRLGKYFSGSSFFIYRHLGRHYKKRLIVKRSCDISYSAEIGKRLTMPHPIGIVIGEGVEVKDDVVIFQQVTLGSHGKKNQENRYPVIENGVKIYTGAKIIGGITLGENSIVGANAVVNINVPANSIVVGIPGRILEQRR